MKTSCKYSCLKNACTTTSWSYTTPYRTTQQFSTNNGTSSQKQGLFGFAGNLALRTTNEDFDHAYLNVRFGNYLIYDMKLTLALLAVKSIWNNNIIIFA